MAAGRDDLYRGYLEIINILIYYRVTMAHLPVNLLLEQINSGKKPQ
jgi:hypothetical protein